jgi:hypothetical protein
LSGNFSYFCGYFSQLCSEIQLCSEKAVEKTNETIGKEGQEDEIRINKDSKLIDNRMDERTDRMIYNKMEKGTGKIDRKIGWTKRLMKIWTKGRMKDG